jgi:phosphoribosylformimino-5-aminoimidazole carboxamide ribotide isomerase
MLIIPAIDLLDGKCVRLFKGDYKKAKVYSNDPAGMAVSFEQAGARLIHLVDLDAAYGAGKNNRAAINKIYSSVSCELEVGGGIRSSSDIRELLGLGITRLVLGTILVKNPGQAAAWIAELGFQAIGGIDALAGKVKISGWTDKTGTGDTELASGLKALGIKEIIYTSISRDGTLLGPDLARTNAVAAAAGLPVILSGGIGSEKDIAAVAGARHKNVYGVIVGKALYEQKVDLADLIRIYQLSTDGVSP